MCQNTGRTVSRFSLIDKHSFFSAFRCFKSLSLDPSTCADLSQPMPLSPVQS